MGLIFAYSYSECSGNPLLSFAGIEDKTHTQDDASLEGDIGILHQSDWITFCPTCGFEERADSPDWGVVGDTLHVVGDRSSCSPDGGVLQVGRGGGPRPGLDRPGDGEPVGDHGVQSDLAGVALGECVGGDQSERAVRLQQRGDALRGGIATHSFNVERKLTLLL